MDIKWLEDFLALVDYGSFTKAAEKRYVTQPAFSRRIRSLENWLGVELVDRNTYPTRLTPLGEEFTGPLRGLLNDIYGLQADMQARQARTEAAILSTQASLSVSFCPDWFSRIRPLLSGGSIRVVAGNLYDCLDQFLAGHSDMLLCYALADINPLLERGDLRRMRVGKDCLIPVCAQGAESSVSIRDSDGTERYAMVSFPPESFFGQLIHEYCIPGSESSAASFQTVFETALSESVHAHVLAGAGMAWLPASLVEYDLETKRLVQLTDLFALEMEIVFLTQAVNCSAVVEDIWQFMQQQYP